jgi:4-hydroxy-3-polyprenylbenzoate decarboxylase
MLRRSDWRRDLHFQTRTTIDTLDYSGRGFNQGSKLIIAATGQPIRQLPTELPAGIGLPEEFRDPALVIPGVLAINAPPYCRPDDRGVLRRFAQQLGPGSALEAFPLITLVDDSDFCQRTLANWLWVTFTRSDPATDIDGMGATTIDKHWGCSGPLVVDARIKPHHAPPVIEDPETSRKVDARAARGGPLARFL